MPVVLVLSTSSCYWGFGAGPTFPQGRSPSKDGANSTAEIGFQYDYRRIARLMFLGSAQMFGGAVMTVDGGQRVVVPLGLALGTDVTAFHLSSSTNIRGMARVYWGSDVRIGPSGSDTVQPDSHTLGGLFGATLHWTSDEEGLGPLGLSFSAGILTARADAPALGRVTFLAPMLLVGFDFFPPTLLKCWFIDEKCPHYFRPVPN